jgi:hypothetical protein
MYNLHYVPTTLGYKVEEELYLGVREQKRLNTTVLWHGRIPSHNAISEWVDDFNVRGSVVY